MPERKVFLGARGYLPSIILAAMMIAFEVDKVTPCSVHSLDSMLWIHI